MKWRRSSVDDSVTEVSNSDAGTILRTPELTRMCHSETTIPISNQYQSNQGHHLRNTDSRGAVGYLLIECEVVRPVKHSLEIGWIAVLNTERAAVTALLDELHDPPTDFTQHHSDDNAYTWGQISGHNVVITSLPAGVHGLTAAATTARGLKSSLPSIEIGLLVGIGAAVLESGRDIRLGDVAVSESHGASGAVVQYDAGKAKGDGQWEPRGTLYPPSRILLKALSKLQAQHKLHDNQIPAILEEAGKKNAKFAEDYSHPGADKDRLFHIVENDDTIVEEEKRRPERQSLSPQIHYGTIASGNTLVQDARTRQKIYENTGQTCICLEMEAAGLMDIFPCLVIRGISDYADSHKNDGWHYYASATAAAFAKELLRHVPQFEKTGQRIQVEKASEFMQALYTCPYLDRKNINIRNIPGTCKWLTEHQQFKNWQDRGATLLWVSADPGCGKSVLARHLVDDVLPKAGKKVCYFFFKEDFPDQKSSANAICALLRQLLDFYPNLITQKMLEKFENDRPFYLQSVQTLWDAFIDASQRAPAEIICVLDALDECRETDRLKLFKNICEFAQDSWTTPKLKFLVTSRPYSDIQDGFRDSQKSSLNVHLSGDGDDEVKKISQEIDTVIRYRIEQISQKRQLTSHEEHSLIDSFVSKPQRTYLWAYLTLDDIEKTPEFSRATISRIVEQLPQTLHEAYERILDRSVNREKARLLLHLIVQAERPLSLSELCAMLALTDKQSSLSELDKHIEPQERFKNTVRNLCGLLVVVRDTKVYFLHQTARDFLIDSKETAEESSSRAIQGQQVLQSFSWKGILQPEISHHILAERCLRFLALWEDSEGSADAIASALFEYCNRFWPHHFRNSDIKAYDPLIGLAVRYSNDIHPQSCKIWDSRAFYELSGIFAHGVDGHMLDGHGYLNRLCLLGLTQLVIHFLDNTVFLPWKRKKVLSRALTWAALGGHAETAHLLLELGASTNSEPLYRQSSDGLWRPLQTGMLYSSSKSYKSSQRFPSSNRIYEWSQLMAITPLHSAVRERNMVLATSLLNKGAHINAIESFHGLTPLHIAAAQGDQPMIRLLLKHGAKKTILEKCERTPLLLFYVSPTHGNDCSTITGLLWNEGANISGNGHLLWLASGHGCLNCLKSVLKRTEGVPNYDEQVAAALLEAIRTNCDSAAKLMIEAGVDVNIQDKDGTTPLMRGASRQRSSAVMLNYLLDHGADPNLQDDTGSSSIHHVWTVEALETLLAHGSDINAKDNSGTTPLLQTLLDGGRFATLRDRHIWVPYSERTALYDAMLSHGADPDIKNKYGHSARMMSFQSLDYFEGHFSASCSQICLDSKMNLSANGSKYTGTRIRSSLNLCDCIGNDNGKLVWNENGAFHQSARNVRLSNQGRVLVAEVLDTRGNWKVSHISLDERIFNHNGCIVWIRTPSPLNKAELRNESEKATKLDSEGCISGGGGCVNCYWEE